LDIRKKALPVDPGTIDVALLFDVTHAVFFPTPEQRRDLFAEVHRVLSPAGRMLVYPTHVRQHGPPLAQLHAEVEASGFVEASRSRHLLLHDDRPVRGWELYRRINRPHPTLTFDQHVEGLRRFARMQRLAKLWIEVMLVSGMNDTTQALTDLRVLFDEINPDEIPAHAVPSRDMGHASG